MTSLKLNIPYDQLRQNEAIVLTFIKDCFPKNFHQIISGNFEGGTEGGKGVGFSLFDEGGLQFVSTCLFYIIAPLGGISW